MGLCVYWLILLVVCSLTNGFKAPNSSLRRPFLHFLKEESEEELPEDVRISKVKVNDGGSDLTDRFKYKVNALMGAFDPAQPENDTERQQGNIMNALLTFPVNHTFHVVGKTNGDESLKNQFLVDVKSTVQDLIQTEDITYQVTARGKKFTKISMEIEMDSADTIASLYEQFGELELSVMSF